MTFSLYSDRPVMWPTQYWEGQMVGESSTIQEADGTFTMFYIGGSGYDKPALGMAKSTDGINWTKNITNPVLGQGRGNVIYVAHASVVKLAGVYHCYFCGDDLAIHHSQSTNGLVWTTPTVALATPVWATVVANSWVYPTPAGGANAYRMMFDYSTSRDSAGKPTFADYHMGNAYSITGPAGPFSADINNMTGLTSTPSCGAPSGFYDPVTRSYDMIYLATPDGGTANVPSNIYRAHTDDWHLQNWTRTPSTPILTYGGPMADWAWDQVGDPDPVKLSDGTIRLYFDGTDNRASGGSFKSCIGLAIQAP